MRKISLDVNDLQVESFETADEKLKERGTVQGYEIVLQGPVAMLTPLLRSIAVAASVTSPPRAFPPAASVAPFELSAPAAAMSMAA